jgi:hypothetical protein
MRCIDLVEGHREALEALAGAGFNLRHLVYADAVREYLERAGKGEKREYLWGVFAERLKVSPRTFRRIAGGFLASARRRERSAAGSSR